jgi:5-methyltetrahydrofolate--homocysteine methyltransferase
MHERVRKEFWGYAGDETLFERGPDREPTRASVRRRAIRPSPDHTEKATLFRAAPGRAPNAGVKLTESYAMWPGSSVGALSLAPRRLLFRRRQGRARPGRGLCRRKGMDIREVERWLAPILNYEPSRFGAEAAE